MKKKREDWGVKPAKVTKPSKLALLSPEKRKEKVEQVYELLKVGTNRYEIMTTLARELNASEQYVRGLITDAYKYAQGLLHKDKEYIFHLHMDRYEKMYEENIVMTNDWGQPLTKKADWQIMVAKYGYALKALRSKEKLLGLHDKSVTVELENNKIKMVDTHIETRGSISGINLDKLNFEEQVELLNLLRKTRVTAVEGVRELVIRTTTVVEVNNGNAIFNPLIKTKEQQEQEVLDIIHEVMPTENVLPQIIVKPPKEESLAPIDKLKKSGKDLGDLKKKINEADKQYFKDLLKQKKQK